MGIVSDSVVFLSEIVVVALLYVLLKPVSRALSLHLGIPGHEFSTLKLANVYYTLVSL